MATASPGYTLLDAFIPDILQYCNGAPSIMVRIHVLNTAIEFCEKTLILKQNASAIELEEDVHTYTLKYPSDRYRAIAIDEVKVGTATPLKRTTEREMDSEFRNWRSTDNSTPTRYWLTDATNKIRFWPTPNADDDEDTIIKTLVTYKRGQTEMDDFIYEKWYDAIKSGAIASLLLIPGATWFDVQLSQIFTREFKLGKQLARKTTLTGTGKYPGRVIPQNFELMGSNANRGSI